MAVRDRRDPNIGPEPCSGKGHRHIIDLDTDVAVNNWGGDLVGLFEQNSAAVTGPGGTSG